MEDINSRYSQVLRGAAGFSLPELIMAMAVSMILMTVSLDEINRLNSLKKRVEAKTDSRVDAKLIVNFLTSTVRQVGGSFVRPWMALWVEDNCLARGSFKNCMNSDRLSYALLDRDLDFCTVLSATKPNRLNFDPNLGQCCAENLNGHQLIVVNGNSFSHFLVSGTHHDKIGGECYLQVSDGQMSPLNQANGVADFTDWAGSNMALTKVETIYLDRNNLELRRFRQKADGENDVDVLLVDQVLDFQLILGYDNYPQDGRINNDNSDQDEWLYNSTANGERLGSGGLNNASLFDLRMIGLGVITYSTYGGGQNKISDSSRDTHLFNGADRRAEGNLNHMTSAESRIYFRSSYVFSE